MLQVKRKGAMGARLKALWRVVRFSRGADMRPGYTYGVSSCIIKAGVAGEERRMGEDIFTVFYGARDEENAVRMAAYMRNKFPFLGIQKPKRRELSRAFLKQKKKEKQVDWPFIWKCYGLPEREFHYLALAYLDAVKKRLTPADMGAIKQLVLTHAWWDSTDSLDAIVGDICLRYPEVKETTMREWMGSDSIWLRRISIDFQLRYKEKTDTAFLRRAILANTGTGEFFINKAIGWSLREYSKVDKEWVRRFLAENRLSPLSRKEAGKYL